jgi:predicted nucleotidyltransferase
MNTIRNDFPPDVKNFITRLKNYLDTELYFYGSVNRSDYVHGKSDIDIAIFSENEKSTITKLQHFLHVKRDAFDKIIWKLNGKLIYGYKIKCDKHMETTSKCEIVIYNEEYKNLLLNEMSTKARSLSRKDATKLIAKDIGEMCLNSRQNVLSP